MINEPINEFELDLDVYAPRPKYVKLEGGPLEVYPPKYKDILGLLSVISKFQEVAKKKPDPNFTKEQKQQWDMELAKEQMQIFTELENALCPIIPKIKEHNLSMEQLNILVEYTLSMATPKDSAALEKAGITPVQEGEKKEAENA